MPHICSQFSSLTSLRVICKESQLGVLFTALSKLPQLVHLALSLNWQRESGNQLEQQQPLPRPLAQLTSLRALQLFLFEYSHSRVQWLNLPVTMPRLQAIHLLDFQCEICGVSLNKYLESEYSEDTKPSTSTALKCLCDTFPLLHPGVPHDRIILGQVELYPTLEQLLSAKL